MSLAPTPPGSLSVHSIVSDFHSVSVSETSQKRRDDIAVADMVADMAAGMEVDKVADKIDDIMADMAADKKKRS